MRRVGDGVLELLKKEADTDVGTKRCGRASCVDVVCRERTKDVYSASSAHSFTVLRFISVDVQANGVDTRWDEDRVRIIHFRGRAFNQAKRADPRFSGSACHLGYKPETTNRSPLRNFIDAKAINMEEPGRAFTSQMIQQYSEKVSVDKAKVEKTCHELSMLLK